MNTKKVLLCALLAACMAAGIWALPSGFISLASLQRYHAALAGWQQGSPVLSAGIYFLTYTLMAALSIPGTVLLKLLGGSLFGLGQGTLLVSFASTLGATLAMLASRYLLQAWVSRRFARQMHVVNQGVTREGAFYLFALRVMPLFPFVLVNLLSGLTRITVRRYWWVSQLGMLPATVIYLNAGRQIGQLTSLRDIISPGMLAAFALLGLLPLASRWLVTHFTKR